MIFLIHENELKEADFYILYFYKQDMVFHSQIVDSLKKIESAYGVEIIGINIENFIKLKKQFNINCVPTMVVINNNEIVQSIVGYHYEPTLSNTIKYLRGNDAKKSS